MKIFTTFDLISQNEIERAARIGIKLLKEKKKLKDLEIAMIVINKYTGEIQSLIGSSQPNLYGYNRALQVRHAIGSLSKIITYLTILSESKKYHFNIWIADCPIFFKLNKNKYWILKNNNHRFIGKIMLIDALINSTNIPIVNLSLDVGLKNIIQNWCNLGIDKSKISFLPSISLGAINLTPIEVAQVFQVIKNNGKQALLSSVNFVVSNTGKVLYKNIPQAKRIVSSEVSCLILYAMQEVVNHGPAKSLESVFKNFFLTGKTGITNNLVDSWFVGIDEKNVIIIWVGRDSNKSTKLYGSSSVIQIYKKYLEYYSPTPLELKTSRHIKNFYVDKFVNLFCTSNVQHSRELPIWFVKNYNFCKH